MNRHEAVNKMMLSIKLQEGIPQEYYTYVRELFKQIYTVGWEQGRRDLIDMQNRAQCKIVAQYNKDRKLIATYRSLKEASKKTGFSRYGIQKAIKRETSTRQKWIWEYLNVPVPKPEAYTF